MSNHFSAAAFACLLVSAGAHAQDASDLQKLNAEYADAIALRDSGDLAAAIEALEALLANAPQYQRARLELAVAYYRAAYFDKARANAQQVLDDPGTPANVKDTVKIFLAQIDTFQQADDQLRHRVGGRVTIGAGYDSNVNAGPSTDIININGNQFTLSNSSTAREDGFGSLGLELNHVYRVPGSFGIAGTTATTQWRTGLQLFRRGYVDEQEFNLDVVSLSTGPAFLSRNNWRAQIALQADYVRLDDTELAFFYGVAPSLTFIRGATEYTVSALANRQEYQQSQDRGKTGNRYGLGLGVTHRLNRQWIVGADINGSINDADAADQRYDALGLNASATWAGWANGAAFGRLTLNKADYEGDAPVFGIPREDESYQLTLGATHSFAQNPLKGWQLTAQAKYTDNSSNLAIYDYQRTEVMAELSRAF